MFTFFLGLVSPPFKWILLPLFYYIFLETRGGFVISRMRLLFTLFLSFLVGGHVVPF